MKDELGKYGLPIDIRYCRACTRSNQRPYIAKEFKENKEKKKTFVTLNDDGLCGGCQYNIIKNTKIDWKSREKELEDLCNRYRKNNGEYDVLVPGSGGKDSVLVAHKLKYKYNMNPLLCTWRPNLPTPEGELNYLKWLDIGFPSYMIYQNQKSHKILTKLAFLNLCHPFQPFIIGQKNLAPKISMQTGIDFIMFGEHDCEFGSGLDRMNIPTMDTSYFTESVSNYNDIFLGGKPVPQILDEYKMKLSDLNFYLPIDKEVFENSNSEFHFFSYYEKWNFHDNYYYVLENSNFLPAPERLEGGYDKYASFDDKIDWLHFYTYFIKFGMGRATSGTEQEIRAGVIDRNEGISLIKKFDGEFPKKYFQDILDYLDVDEKTFYDVIDRARPDHIWKKENNNWKLRKPIWQEKEFINDKNYR